MKEPAKNIVDAIMGIGEGPDTILLDGRRRRIKDLNAEELALALEQKGRRDQQSTVINAGVRYANLESSAAKQLLRFRQNAGKAREGKYGVVRQVIERLRPKDLGEFLHQLKDDKQLDLIASDSLGPIDFDYDDIDRERETVSYLTKGKAKEVSFKRLKNIIAKEKAKPVVT